MRETSKVLNLAEKRSIKEIGFPVFEIDRARTQHGSHVFFEEFRPTFLVVLVDRLSSQIIVE